MDIFLVAGIDWIYNFGPPSQFIIEVRLGLA